MAIHPQRLQRQPEAPPPWRLTDALDEKLSELKAAGYEIIHIECSREDLTTLVVEGGEDAIRLDPDPSLDRAWYGDVEIRHAADRDLTWVFLRGEDPSGELSAHIVSAS